MKNELWNSFKSKGINITPDHWIILSCLWQKEGITQTELAENAKKDRANLTRILDVMEKKDLIIRDNHEKDRRSFRIFYNAAASINKKATRKFTKTEIDELKRLVKKIIYNL
jgi:DNA-binding MarR family transcriptional regulator